VAELNFQNDIVRDDAVRDREKDEKSNQIWSAFLNSVNSNLSALKFNTWFKPIRLKSYEDNTLLISVPSQDYYDMIISRFGDIVTTALESAIGKDGKLVYEIDSTVSMLGKPENGGNPENEPPAVRTQDKEFSNYAGLHSEPVHQYQSNITSPYRPAGCFNQDYTFDNFVKGKNNEFATAAALSISNRPGAQYNPLMIYGGVGLGKTHLVQAIGNHLRQNHPVSNIMYISGPEFTTSFVQSIRSNKAHEFERFYKSLDILMVDDIQFLEGKESTQDSFFQIFNSLYQLKKQIVLSCDKPPHQLEGLEERLITRFQWGLTVDIQPPDLETRIAILNKKCEAEKVVVSYDVLEFIALNIKDNIRSLEGCLKSIIFDAEISHSLINLDIAKRSVVKFGVVKNRKQNLDISTIIAVVSKFFDIDESLLRLKSKRQEIVKARHTAMYISKELTQCSLQTIGAHFGGRNHATVIHACKCIEVEIINNKSFADKIQSLKETLLTS
jgi:chromosomal replication initiator protein